MTTKTLGRRFMEAAERNYIRGWLCCMLIVLAPGGVVLGFAVAGRDPSDPTVDFFIGLTISALCVGSVVLGLWSALAILCLHSAPIEVRAVGEAEIRQAERKSSGQFSLLDLMEAPESNEDPVLRSVGIVNDGNVIRVSFAGRRRGLRQA